MSSSATTSSPPSFLQSAGALVIVAVCAAGLATGIIAGLGEIHTRPSELELMGKSDENLAAREAADHSALRKNSKIGVAITGAVLAGFMGLGTGLIYRTPTSGVLGLALGIVLGGLLGFGGASLEILVLDTAMNSPETDPLIKGMAGHAIAWGVIGVAAGIAAGIATGNRIAIPRTVGAAILAGLLAAMLFGPVASVIFPLSRADLALPDRTEATPCKVLWIALNGVLTALLLGWTYSHREPVKAIPAVEAT